MIRRSARLARVTAWALVALVVAGCTEARRKKDPPAPASPAPSAPAPPAPSAPATAPPAATTAAAAPAPSEGRVLLVLSAQGPARLGGFSLTMNHDPERLSVAEPVTTASLQGYICQANLQQPGRVRFNCAGIVNEDRGGRLATFEIRHAGAPPTVESFQVEAFEAVDDFARPLPAWKPVLTVEPIPAP